MYVGGEGACGHVVCEIGKDKCISGPSQVSHELLQVIV